MSAPAAGVGISGLPYHGGPGNNYSTHAIACMVERLRARPGASGVVTGVGWYLTKHSVGVYSSAPAERAMSSTKPTSTSIWPGSTRNRWACTCSTAPARTKTSLPG